MEHYQKGWAAQQEALDQVEGTVQWVELNLGECLDEEGEETRLGEKPSQRERAEEGKWFGLREKSKAVDLIPWSRQGNQEVRLEQWEIFPMGEVGLGQWLAQ